MDDQSKAEALEEAITLHPYTRNVGGKISLWQQRSETHETSQKSNPFSQWGNKPQGSAPGIRTDQYGRPVEGSRTEYRGKSAGVLISSEVVELCNVIYDLGEAQPDGSIAITFGILFETYTRISNKLVGMLMRARKQKLLDFEGEMLYQKRDDHVIIRLIDMPEELAQDIERRKAELAEHPGNVKATAHSSFK